MLLVVLLLTPPVLSHAPAPALSHPPRPVRLDKDMEEVYKKLFLPLKVPSTLSCPVTVYSQVTRRQFHSLLGGSKERRRLAPKEFVIEEKVSRVNSLSLVLNGRYPAPPPSVLLFLHLVSSLPFLLHLLLHLLPGPPPPPAPQAAGVPGWQGSPHSGREPIP